MQIGMIVKWTYRHALRSGVYTYITKIGKIKEITGKVKNKRYVSGTHAKVHFMGNKTISKVPINELLIIPELN
ncbi:MAG: hypothetical protein GY804_04670 [Alphaproteobacteria bacterium]|nr:hypothetical protein [Alphaproteobacteria bacterium]